MVNLTVFVSATNTPRLDISVIFLGIEHISANWTVIDTNLEISHSDLGGANFTVRMTGSGSIGYIEISNSTWGQLNVSRGFNIKVSDCQMGSRAIPVINSASCNVSVSNSIFLPVVALVRAVSSHFYLANVTITQFGYRTPIIRIMNESTVYINNSLFLLADYWEPEMLMTISMKSNATLINCTFSCKSRPCRYMYGKRKSSFHSQFVPEWSHANKEANRNISNEFSFGDVAVVRSRLIVSKCIFDTIHVSFQAMDYSEITALDSTFYNSVFLLYASKNAKVNFSGCLFLRSYGTNTLFSLSNSTVYVNNSNFTLNNVNDDFDDYFMCLVDTSKAYLQNSYFSNNFFKTSFLSAQSQSFLLIENCFYMNNIEPKQSTSDFVFIDAVIRVKNSTFFNKNSNYKFQAFIDVTSSRIQLHGSSFHQVPDTGLLLKGMNNQVDVDSCSMEMDFDLIDLLDSVLDIKNSIFHCTSVICVFDVKIRSTESNFFVSVVNSVFIRVQLTVRLAMDVSIDSSHFEDASVVVYGDIVRTANSRFATTQDYTSLLFLNPVGIKQLDFRTLDTILYSKNSSIRSNLSDFMELGRKTNLIAVYSLSRIQQIETPYASRKYNSDIVTVKILRSKGPFTPSISVNSATNL